MPKEGWQVAQADENRCDEVVSTEIRRRYFGARVLRKADDARRMEIAQKSQKSIIIVFSRDLRMSSVEFHFL